MPELPEVETTLRGILPHIAKQRIKRVVVRHYSLRWPIHKNIDHCVRGQVMKTVYRRAKYLLLQVDTGTMILHLGMSGSLRVLVQEVPPKKHDHFDIEFENNIILRYTDPRRFGAFLWTEEDPELHPLLIKLGPEPLTSDFSPAYLFKISRKRNVPIKSFIMNNHIVVGVGNIYATEVLFLTGLHPNKPAKALTEQNCRDLVRAIKRILHKAIKAGGTTLKDFVNTAGKPGYFKQQLHVYGRAKQPCLQCKTPLKSLRIAQRNTMYCPECQK